MSFGTTNYQPFNPTAGMSGPLGQVPGMVMKSLGNAMQKQYGGPMPGAQDPNQQQYFQKSNQPYQNPGQAVQNMQGMFGGGKGGGGGSGKSMPSPSIQPAVMPGNDVYDVEMPNSFNPGQMTTTEYRPWLSGNTNY